MIPNAHAQVDTLQLRTQVREEAAKKFDVPFSRLRFNASNVGSGVAYYILQDVDNIWVHYSVLLDFRRKNVFARFSKWDEVYVDIDDDWKY